MAKRKSTKGQTKCVERKNRMEIMMVNYSVWPHLKKYNFIKQSYLY